MQTILQQCGEVGKVDYTSLEPPCCYPKPKPKKKEGTDTDYSFWKVSAIG